MPRVTSPQQQTRSPLQQPREGGAAPERLSAPLLSAEQETVELGNMSAADGSGYGERAEHEVMREDESDYDDDDDDDAEILTGQNATGTRGKILKLLGSIPVQVALLVLLLVDLVIVIYLIVDEEKSEAADDCKGGQYCQDADSTVENMHWITFVNAFIFFVEVWVRAWATGWGDFFGPAAAHHRRWNIAESSVITLCAVFEVISLILMEKLKHSKGKYTSSFLLSIMRCFRFARVMRGFMVIHERTTLARKKARNIVSADRRRFREGGFDLDLTYITENDHGKIVAMSWPSTGTESFYRNPIWSVEKLMDMKHEGKYKVYNLCSERAYDAKHFHGRVERFELDDHNAGDLQQLRAFCESAEAWLQSKEHVIVVHCKGGKGRTGTMICAWLMWSKQYPTAREAMTLFGSHRTDDNPKSKFQGVEAPSQERYLKYFDAYLNQFNKVIPTRTLRLKSIEVGPLPRHCPSAGSLWCVVLQGSRKHQLWTSHPGRRFRGAIGSDGRQVQAVGNDAPHTQRFVAIAQAHGAMDVLAPDEYARRYPAGSKGPRGSQFVKYEPDVLVTDDTRVHFFYKKDKTNESPTIENHVFGVWLHTSFVDPSRRLSFSRQEVDKAHKDRSGKRFDAGFVVELDFEDAGSPHDAAGGYSPDVQAAPPFAGDPAPDSPVAAAAEVTPAY